MQQNLTLLVSQYLSSKILHNLISPNSAINNGVELMAELGPDQDCINLIQNSAENLQHSLSFYRLAFGQGIPTNPWGQLYRELQSLCKGYFAKNNIELTWQEIEVPESENTRPLIKLLANMIIVAGSTLIRGGQVTIEPGLSFPFRVRGQGVAVKIDEDELAPILNPNVFHPENQLSTSNVQPYLCKLLADHYSKSLTIENVSEQEMVIGLA